MAAVRLQKYEPSDLPGFVELFADPEVMLYVDQGLPLERAAAEALFAKIFDVYERDPEFFIWAVYEGDEYAGHAELKRRPGRPEYELIYLLERRRWGRSLGSSVVDLLLAQARKRSLAFVIATVDDKNAASLAILRRNGFERERELSIELGCGAYRLNL